MARGSKTKREALSSVRAPEAEDERVPSAFAAWFAAKGWMLRPHQRALLRQSRQRRSTLLIAPTGSGKTMAGFLPSLVSLAESSRSGLHTLYVSPLKALAADIQRNLMTPVRELQLGLRIETRTGDTGASAKQRQLSRPPHILLTTPEQIALILSRPGCERYFADLDTIVVDELHALAPGKRGDLLALDIARLSAMSPDVITVGLSATVARPSELRAWLAPQSRTDATLLADLVELKGGAAPQITILEGEDPLPWSGHSARYAMRRVYEEIQRRRLALIFVNTRSQAELVFQELWRINEESLPIALHHGSLDAARRRKVEAAMAAGTLRAVVATSTLDLGIDWGDVDLVIHVGAPKGASRLIQRVGRANHRLEEPSRALLVPSNRFEVLECRAAIEAAAEGAQDAVHDRRGAIDVLAQHVFGVACAGPFHPDALYRDVCRAAPYSGLARARFDRIVDFVSTGGYALRAYERFARLRPAEDGRLRLAHPRLAQLYRMNAGTIVEAAALKVRLIGRKRAERSKRTGATAPAPSGRVLGEVEEWFAEQLAPGDTFVFAGEVLRFEGIVENALLATRSQAREPKVPTYAGGRFPLSTHLAQRVRTMLARPDTWSSLPTPVAEWLALQQEHSIMPAPDEVLIETFPRAGRHYLVAYPFEGRLAHQTLGMLLTRRLDRYGAAPLGFVASDYALAVWGLGDMGQMIAEETLSLDQLFAQDMLGDDLEAWLAETSLMKRTFRSCAVIAGLVERRHPGREKSGRQVTVSSDLIYDVLRRHDPRHILLEAAWEDAASGLLDIRRLGAFLQRIRGRIRHVRLQRISPLAVPVILEIGRELVFGSGGSDRLLRLAGDDLVREARAEP